MLNWRNIFFAPRPALLILIWVAVHSLQGYSQTLLGSKYSTLTDLGTIECNVLRNSTSCFHAWCRKSGACWEHPCLPLPWGYCRWPAGLGVLWVVQSGRITVMKRGWVQHSGQLPPELKSRQLVFSYESLEPLNHRTETNHLQCKVAFPLKQLS